MVNGFPLRLVVPGWYGTYWVKALSDVTVLPHVFSNFWTDKAYRIPSAPNGTESPKHLATDTVPINRFNVRSIFVRPEPNEIWHPGIQRQSRASLSTPATELPEWRCRRTEVPAGQMLAGRGDRKVLVATMAGDWTPGNRGQYRFMLVRQMRLVRLRARSSGTAVDSCGMWSSEST